MTYAVTRNECERVNGYVSEKARENRFSTYDLSQAKSECRYPLLPRNICDSCL